MQKDNKEEVVLNEKLQQVIDILGNSPIEEPKLAKVLDEKSLKRSKVIKMALKSLKTEKLSIKDFTAMEVASFYQAVRMKILSHTLADGTFKSTPNTENFKLPDYEQVELLTEILVKIKETKVAQSEIQQQIINKEKVDADKLSELVDELSLYLKQVDTLVWEISGLNQGDLSKWEQQLMSEQIFICVRDVEKTSLGKL